MKRASEESAVVHSNFGVEGLQKRVKPNKELQETHLDGKHLILKSEQLHPASINGSSKSNKYNGVGDRGVMGIDDEFEALISNNSVLREFAHPTLPESATEAARRNLVERLAAEGSITEQMLVAVLAELREEAPHWGAASRLRSIALVLVYVARSSRTCRASFVANGLPLLGELLHDSVSGLEGSNAPGRQEAAMRVQACLTCLGALPLGRATMWEHRLTVGKGFDQLHRWCGQTKTALAADLRAPTVALCHRWRKQPRPAFQDTSPEQKKVRIKVIEIIRQGMLGIAGVSPISPAVACNSPCLLPPATVAAEVEAALFGHHNGNTPEYRQHARMLRTNLALAGNSALRERILSGDINAETLVSMDSRSLAPECLQVQRRIAAQEALKLAVVTNSPKLISWSEKGDRFEPDMEPLPPPEDSNVMAAPTVLDIGASPTLPMEPPPTPFQGGNPPTPFRGVEDGAAPTPEVIATPGLEEEREHETELIRWFSKPM